MSGEIDEELLENLVFVRRVDNGFSGRRYLFADKSDRQIPTYELSRQEIGQWTWTGRGMVRKPHPAIDYRAFRIPSSGTTPRVAVGSRIENTLRLILFPECSDD